MAVDHEQDAVIDFLSKPEHYGLPGAKIERIDTHGAIVFLIGDHAYKLKRAVKFPYMDFSTPERRKEMCERELTINRRTAPDIYLEVRSILQGVDGYLRFGPDEAAAARDHVVVMRRFDQATLFGRLCDAGKLTPALIRGLAETLADFHGRAEITTEFGGADGIARVIGQNETEFAGMIDDPFPAAAVKHYAQASRAALEAARPLLDGRRVDDRVRRCHGDLHLDNVFLHDGKPMLFDAIEFEDDFACIDVLYDLAFLIMDLIRHGAARLAQALLSRYLELTGDYDGLKALPLFLACRAGIRAHAAVSRARAKGGDRSALKEGRGYLDLALRFLKPAPPRLIAIGGLSGTGKTTVARLVAPPVGPAPGAVILRSDVTRKHLMGVDETTRLPASAYTPEVNTKVFTALAETAARVLDAGHGVVMDAVYGRQPERETLTRIAAKAGARFDGFWLTADPAILIERIAARRGDASDADRKVLEQQLASIAAPAEWTAIDASGTPEAIAEIIVTHLNSKPQIEV